MPALENPPIELLLEALLFVAEGPLTVDDLTAALDCAPEVVERGLAALERALSVRGVRLTRAGKRVEMVTAAEAAPAIERYLGQDAANRLSSAALEALAIVAYRQPVTRAQVEAIRGVNSDGVLRTLQNKGLIGSVGRLEQVGRPEVLGTTIEFLHYLGIHGLEELQSLPELEEPSNGEGLVAPALPQQPSPAN